MVTGAQLGFGTTPGTALTPAQQRALAQYKLRGLGSSVAAGAVGARTAAANGGWSALAAQLAEMLASTRESRGPAERARVKSTWLPTTTAAQPNPYGTTQQNQFARAAAASSGIAGAWPLARPMLSAQPNPYAVSQQPAVATRRAAVAPTSLASARLPASVPPMLTAQPSFMQPNPYAVSQQTAGAAQRAAAAPTAAPRVSASVAQSSLYGDHDALDAAIGANTSAGAVTDSTTQFNNAQSQVAAQAADHLEVQRQQRVAAAPTAEPHTSASAAQPSQNNQYAASQQANAAAQATQRANAATQAASDAAHRMYDQQQQRQETARVQSPAAAAPAPAPQVPASSQPNPYAVSQQPAANAQRQAATPAAQRAPAPAATPAAPRAATAAQPNPYAVSQQPAVATQRAAAAPVASAALSPQRASGTTGAQSNPYGMAANSQVAQRQNLDKQALDDALAAW